MRKIVFPIHFKLIGFTLAILGASLGFYVYYAIDLFKTDKIAYVFESVSSQNEQVAQGLEFKLENAFSMTGLLNKAKNSTRIAREVFQKNPSLIGYLEFKEDELERSVFASELEGVDIEAFRSFLNSRLVSPRGAENVSFGEKRFFMVWERGHLTLWTPNYLSSAFPESDLYAYDLVLKGDEALGGLRKAVSDRENIQQTFVFESEPRMIVAMEPVLEGAASVFTAADYTKAIEASLNLRDKSLYFGLFTAGIAIFLVLLFSRFFTRPIEKLFKASQRFSERDFSHRVKLSTGDELGVLGDSFNHMADEIGHYMEEMEEKSRLENELRTAQLVQESFFPRDSIDGSSMKLKAYYRPASECGGDWWGFLDSGDCETVIMIDVTGHGTAAALVTAVIHNSLTALKFIGKKDPDFLKSPAKIMSLLNESLLSVEVNIFATAFVLSIDKSDGNSVGAARYSNASHNPPYRVPAKQNLEKNDFVPLMDKLGPRLGEKSESVYYDVELERGRGEKILLYTDGILEMENQSSKAYGTRRFIKRIIELALEDPAHLIDETVKNAFEFAEGVEPKDDITLICLELK